MYRETKLEQPPKVRTNPTFSSTVFNTNKSYTTPAVSFFDLKKKKGGDGQSVSVQSQQGKGETAYQRQFSKPGYKQYVAERKVPMSPTKIGKSY